MCERRAVAIRVFGDPEIGGALGMALGAITGTSCEVGRSATSSVSAGALPPSPSKEESRAPSACAPGPIAHEMGRAQGSGAIDRARMEAEAVAEKWIEGERLKRAVGNYKTAEEYEAMIEAAREDYGRNRIGPISCAVLAMIGLLVLMMTTFLEWEETQWRA